MLLGRVVVPALCMLLTGLASLMPAHAAPRVDGRHMNWNQHDTAVYVVSTLNLVRGRHGQSGAHAWTRRLGVTQFAVYEDTTALTDDVYFIELRKADGSTVAALAYQMGWPRPMALTSNLLRFHLQSAPQKIDSMYKTDTRTLLESFSSTLPA